MPDGIVATHIEKPRASRATRLTASHACLPSIEALARLERACVQASTALHEMKGDQEKHSQPHLRCQNACDLVDDRETALHDLIVTLPARTMSDVLVQIAAIQQTLDPYLDRDERDDVDHQDMAAIIKALNKAFRLTVSIFPVVVAAADVDPAELVEQWHLQRYDHYFGPLAETMGDAA